MLLIIVLFITIYKLSMVLNYVLTISPTQKLAGAKRNVQEKDGLTPLHLAVYHGYVKCVSLLIDHGADVNCTSR